jgi:hypothetical protein
MNKTKKELREMIENAKIIEIFTFIETVVGMACLYNAGFWGAINTLPTVLEIITKLAILAVVSGVVVCGIFDIIVTVVAKFADAARCEFPVVLKYKDFKICPRCEGHVPRVPEIEPDIQIDRCPFCGQELRVFEDFADAQTTVKKARENFGMAAKNLFATAKALNQSVIAYRKAVAACKRIG